MNASHPMISVLAGVPLAAAAPAPSDCPCERQHPTLRTLQGLAGIGEAGTEPTSREYLQMLDDTSAGLDWHWVALIAATAAALYFAWPKPERERRNVQRRQAAMDYRRRLEQIGYGGKAKK